MVSYPDSPYRVPSKGRFKIHKLPTAPPEDQADREANIALRQHAVERIAALQERLYAHDRYSVLLVFQAMDAAGKDSAVRRVLSGVNPAGCVVHSFKSPSSEELDHDFLWRTTARLPPRGVIGVFNRSYYEEVLVIRVNQRLLQLQRVPEPCLGEDLWPGRYRSIRQHEEHLARNGYVILKFWLNVSPREQARRLLARIDDPAKNWKFSSADVEQRRHWDRYMEAYEECLNETSQDCAPWYAIPADKKTYAQRVIAEILCETLESLHMPAPRLPPDRREEMEHLREQLAEDAGQT